MEYLTRLRYLQDNKDNLPHLYGVKRYKWQTEFFQSTNHNNFLVAANQIGKSSIMIAKNIHWATCPSLWPQLWPSKPTQFWYFYPSLGLASREFKERWVKEWLPRGDLKADPIFGWDVSKSKGEIDSIAFGTGVTIYFKSYEQRFANQQAGSVYNISCDEELPEELYDEVNVRRSGINVNGYFHMAFTATLGQEVWRLTMEPEPDEEEMFPDARKWNISCYDCLEYEDGSSTLWSVEEIEKRKARCKSQAEIKRRIYGRFVVDTNLKYMGFSRAKNYRKGHKLPKSWVVWAGIDIGSGGKSGHPSAIAFVATNPEFTAGRIFKGWRGDNISTDASDVLRKYQQLKAGMHPIAHYDFSSADFKKVCDGAGEPMQRADKGRDYGEDLINTLFKNEMLIIYDDPNEPELMKLVIELENLKNSTRKTQAKDDFIDALRYAVSKIPWNFAHLNQIFKEDVIDPDEGMDEREKLRRGRKKKDNDLDIVEAEFDLANEAYNYGMEDDY